MKTKSRIEMMSLIFLKNRRGGESELINTLIFGAR